METGRSSTRPVLTSNVNRSHVNSGSGNRALVAQLCCIVVLCAGCQVEFSPTKVQLASMIGSTTGQLTLVLADIQRLPDLLSRSKSNKDVIYYHSYLF